MHLQTSIRSSSEKASAEYIFRRSHNLHVWKVQITNELSVRGNGGISEMHLRFEFGSCRSREQYHGSLHSDSDGVLT